MKKLLLFLIPMLFCVCSLNAQFGNPENDAAMQLVSASKATLGLSDADLQNVKVTRTYLDNGTGFRMVYLIQTHQDIPVLNQMLVLAYKNGKLVSNAGAFNRSVPKLANVPGAMPSVSAESAVQSALSDRGLHATQMAVALDRKDNGHKIEFGNMGISRENITAQLMWVPVEELVNNVNTVTKVRLAWEVYIIPKTTPDYWRIRVDASDNRILGMTNLTDYDNWGNPFTANNGINYPAFLYGNNNKDSKENDPFDFLKVTNDPNIITTATYRVVPFPAEAPTFPLGAHALRVDPWLAAPGNATSLKWHTVGSTDYSYSRGNNVWAYEDRTAPLNTGSQAKSANSTTALPNLTFDFTPDYTQPPTQTAPVPNQQFNITNLFYWNNVIHDVMYVYGFNEVSANFQDDNQGRGGLGNDHVNAEAQDIGGTNNANFATPPDGSSGRMQMYLWTLTTPQRDGDVDNGIIVHEFGHGISNRFTGGGTTGCLGNAEQMGEGWSDYYGLMFTQDWATATLNTGFNSPRGIGTYALGQPPTGLGIRSQRYCTDFTVNNKVYAASIPAAPHDRGEIWCATLWDMTWNIINQTGIINANLYNLAGGGGNNIAMKLVTEGLRLQQCSPGFISGRNAILAADQALYGGAYSCAIWEAFRRRGMGAYASEGSTSSVTDQIPDFSPPVTMNATVSAATIPETQNLTYTNSVFTCSAVTNHTLRDTLPTNVTYVSGGTYDAVNRVVSFAVNQAAGTTNYPFTVNVNAGSYFPPSTLINEPVAGAGIPASWTTNAPIGSVWTVTNTQSNSAPNSFFVTNLATAGDQRLETTSSYAIPLNSFARLSFWHRWNTEAGWDGGVIEVSTNGGTTWSDVGIANIVTNPYNGGLGAAPTNPISGRPAYTGLQSTFINTIVSLAPWAGQSIKIRFRFGSDDNTTAPTTPAGWWVDDVVLNVVAAVNMRTSLFNTSNVRVSFKDNVTEITQLVACQAVISQNPINAAACAGSSVTFTCVGTATGGVTYQWQLSTTGAGGPWSNLTNAAPYSGVTTSTLTVNPTAVGMNNYQYRCVVTGTCPPDAISTPAVLTVAAASVGGTVSPANSSVCGVTNSGTLTLSGHVGSVIRWESATNIAGPYTPIVNTSTTHNYTNLTQTTYFRAVVQFAGCAPVTSSIATVTFNAANPLVIVAVPGTTLCQGDPAALTVYESTGFAPVTLTQSTSTAITQFNSVSCNAGGLHTDNSYWRAYNLATLGLPGPVTINTVTFGIEQAAGGIQPVTVRLYTSAGAFPGGVRTLIGSQTFNIPNQALTLFTGTFTTPVNVSNTAILVVELFTPSGQATGRSFFIGSNAAAQTGPSYISAAACGVPNPVDLASLGFPNMHIILNVAGTTLGALTPITSGTFQWSPAAGLSSTTTNPVAASPAVTTTYTVNHDNGAGCVRQANITINVNVRPAVTTQPSNVTACATTTATFTVAGVGTGLAYQWQISTTGAGGPWSNLANGAPYSGVNTATLTVNPATVAMNGYQYRCLLTGTCPPLTPGTAHISNPAILTVNALPVVTVTPTTGCGGVAGINGLLLTASGASTYTWAPLAGLYTSNTTIPANAYTGGNTPTVYAAPTSYTAYTVTGTAAGTGCINTAVALINYTPPAPNITPTSVTMCLGDPAVRLTSSTSTNTSVQFCSGPISIPVPDNNPAGISSNISVSGIPTTCNISAMSVTWNMPHTWNGDMVFVLRAPNGQILNLDYYLSATGGAGVTTGFVNTNVSSTGTAALSSGSGTYTGTFRADARTAAQAPFGPPGPTGFAPTTANWSALWSVPNGTYTLAAYDGGGLDLGTLTSWCLNITYTCGVPATAATWSPVGGLFNDANATIPYAGTARDTVWTRPTPSGVYNYTATVQSLPTPPAVVNTPMAGGNGNNLVAFNVRNNNGYPVNFSSISSNSFGSGAIVARVFWKATPIAGNPGPISAANGWAQFGTGNFTVTANTLNQLMTGLVLPIPPGQTYGIALDFTGATFPAYTNGAATTVTYSAGGCDIITGGNVGWGGPAAPGTPANNPRNFNGSISFTASVTACTSPARTVVVRVNEPTSVASQPANQTICTDKVATFSVTAAGSGPFTYQWQVSTDNGNTWANVANGGVYSGATSATLTITQPPVTLSNNFYRCIITGAAPCAAVNSFQARLVVNPLPVITISAAPYVRLFPGLRTTITSTVSPNAAQIYTWLRNGVIVAGANTGTLNVDVDGLGEYRLRVTDVNGCVSTSAPLSILDSVTSRCFIYPNPTSGMFQVRYYSVANNVLPRSLTVYDAKGDRVFTQFYTIGRPYDRMDVDMRKNGKGLYWVEIGDQNGNRLAMCRVVIQ